MRKILFIIMLLLAACLYAEDLFAPLGSKQYDDFRQLPAEGKLQKLLDVYRYNENWAHYLSFAYYKRIIDENREEIIPVLFDYLESLEMVPLKYNDRAYDIIEHITLGYINRAIFNQQEFARLRSILQKKIHEYLITYKVVDVKVVMTEFDIERIDGKHGILGGPPFEIRGLRDMADRVYKKYTQLGYTGLRVDYTNLRN